jgi:excisionase family DNA binding protein
MDSAAAREHASLSFLFEDEGDCEAIKKVDADPERTTSRPRKCGVGCRAVIPHPHLRLSERLLLYRLPLSAEQVAAEVDVDRNTIYRWVRAGTIPVRRAGRYLKFDQGPLAEWAKLREILPLDQW